jgi:hypothetical protein
MLSQTDDRVLEIVTILVVMMTIFICICYAAIFRNPYVTFNPFKPPTATPWGMAEGPPPTFPPTWTPTATRIPTDTPTATNTPTVTNTPTSTGTSTPTRTNTPTVTSTRPPPPPPTATPPPTPTSGPRYSITKYEGISFCGYTEFRFNVKDYRGIGKRDVTIRIWTDWSFDASVTTNAIGEAKKHIGDSFFDSTWHIQLIEDGQVVDQLEVVTTSGCEDPDESDPSDYSVWTIHWQENP